MGNEGRSGWLPSQLRRHSQGISGYCAQPPDQGIHSCAAYRRLCISFQGGLDGKWFAVTNDGKLEEDWKDPEKRKNLKKLGGIMRTPVL